MSEQHLQSTTLPPPMRMMQNIWPGAMAAQAIYVCAKLGIADLLKPGPRTVRDLAAATGTHTESLHRVLRALASLDIFREQSPGTFENTELSSTLRSDVPASMRPWAMFLSAPFNWKLWGDLEETVRSGQPAPNRVYGKPFWTYLAENPDDAAVFNDAMTVRSEMLYPATIAAYDFSRFERIIDVGGGHGVLLHGILSSAPALKGVLYDLPEVVANAAILRSGAVAERAEIVGGSFMEAVPVGADAYILSGVINDWGDEDALRILKNCRRAIKNGGRLLLVTSILKPSTQPDSRNFMDIYMMLFGGRERTEADLGALLSHAGFSVTRVVPTSTANFIVESEPA